jgi:hypothetical protein
VQDADLERTSAYVGFLFPCYSTPRTARRRNDSARWPGRRDGGSSEGNGREPAGASTPSSGTVEGQQRRVMPALSADRRDGDEGSCQGQAPGHPAIDAAGPIEAVGEPDQVDIVLPVAKETLRKSAPPVAAMVDPCPWLVAVTGLPRHRTSASSSALATRRRLDASPALRRLRCILLDALQPTRVSPLPTGFAVPG